MTFIGETHVNSLRTGSGSWCETTELRRCGLEPAQLSREALLESGTDAIRRTQTARSHLNDWAVIEKLCETFCVECGGGDD